LTFDHARALANAASPRVRDALADLQEPIIELAADSSFAQWQGQGRRLLELLDQDGPRPDDDPTPHRPSFPATPHGAAPLRPPRAAPGPAQARGPAEPGAPTPPVPSSLCRRERPCGCRRWPSWSRAPAPTANREPR